jgi:hypothetical protein
MSANDSTTLINAVAYYRRSTDKQSESIPTQQEAVRAYALKNGCRIIREYLDAGISGDEPERRPDFLRLRQDAQEKGDFEAVLCWDQDRFLRTDPLEAGYWIKPLRDRGIYLDTVAQGRVNWDDFAGTRSWPWANASAYKAVPAPTTPAENTTSERSSPAHRAASSARRRANGPERFLLKVLRPLVSERRAADDDRRLRWEVRHQGDAHTRRIARRPPPVAPSGNRSHCQPSFRVVSSTAAAWNHRPREDALLPASAKGRRP